MESRQIDPFDPSILVCGTFRDYGGFPTLKKNNLQGLASNAHDYLGRLSWNNTTVLNTPTSRLHAIYLTR